MTPAEHTPLSSPAESFLYSLHRGATLLRLPLSQGRLCMLDDREIPYREVRELLDKGMVVGEKQTDGATLYRITDEGRSRWAR